MANAKVYLSESEFAVDTGRIRRGDNIGIEVCGFLFEFSDQSRGGPMNELDLAFNRVIPARPRRVNCPSYQRS